MYSISGHLNNIFKKYHIMTQQIVNNLRPTRNLKAKFILQSKKIKRTTDQFEAGLISIWQFMQIASHSSTQYVNRQINWINEIADNSESEPEIHVEQEIEVAEQVTENIALQQNQSTCMVCMINTIQNCLPHVIIPCGHAWVCDICINSLPHPARCPLCRLDNVSFQRIFFN